MSDLSFITIEAFEGPLYVELLLLRQAVLRTPLHQTYTLDELLAERDQTHVGLIEKTTRRLLGGYLLKWQPDAAQLRQMVVATAYQGVGFGSRLLAHAEHTALAHGKTQLFMQARLSAAPFYQRAGYNRAGVPYKHLDINHVDMDKKLT